MLGRKHTLKGSKVEYFDPEAFANIRTSPRTSSKRTDATDIKHVHGVEYVPHFFPSIYFFALLTVIFRLCKHHATGKKKWFVQFVSTVKSELETCFDSYASDYPEKELYEFTRDKVDRDGALEVSNTHYYVLEMVPLMKSIFKGEECYVIDGEFIKTGCRGKNSFKLLLNVVACQISAIISTPSTLDRMTHIINTSGSEFLQGFLMSIFDQISKLSTITYELTSGIFLKLSCLEEIFNHNLDDPSTTFEILVVERSDARSEMISKMRSKVQQDSDFESTEPQFVVGELSTRVKSIALEGLEKKKSSKVGGTSRKGKEPLVEN